MIDSFLTVYLSTQLTTLHPNITSVARNLMNFLNESQVNLIHAALVHYASEQQKIISEHYFDLDQEEVVDESVKILSQIDQILDFLVNKKSLLFIIKSGLFLRLIDAIKVVKENIH